MEVMIAVPLVLPDQPLAVSALEDRVQEWGRSLMRQGMAAAWAAQAAVRPVGACPACGVPESRPAGAKARHVEPVFGPVALPRQRRRCVGCGRHYQPDDAVLAPAFGTGQLSPQLQELAALCGASWPYRQAADILGRVRGIPLSAETVRAVVGTIGTHVATTLAQEAATAVAPPAAAPEPEGAVPDKTLRAPWSARLEERWAVGDVPGALAVLAEVAAAAPHPALAEFAGYVTTLTPCIPNYAERRAAGERIGSGGIEKGVDVVVNRRLKGRRGMRWWRDRIEGLVALRVALLNDAWDRLLRPP